MKLQNGVYPAHLMNSEIKLSGNGKPMICFLWKLDQTGEQIRSYLHLTLKDGSPNVKGIGLVRKWAPDWDGENLYWFGENREKVSSYAVKLTVANEPSWNDPSQTYVSVKWVNPAQWTGNSASASPSADLPMNREELKQHLDTIRPTMKDVWGAFRILFAGASQTVLEQKWFALIDSCRPEGRDVDQFDEADWQRVLNTLAIM